MDYLTVAFLHFSGLTMGWRLSFCLRMFCWMHAFQLPMFPLVRSWMLLLLYLLWGSVSCDCHTGMDVSHRFLSWSQFQVLHCNQLRLFSMSSRRTPCGRTLLTESGLAAFPHPALCETNRSHLSIIYTDIYSRSYQWIAVIYHIQKFYPVVAFLLAPPV